MHARCEKTYHPHYADYGGRGIKVCDRWKSFENFLADMGERPEGMTLERREGDRDYEPGNCKWATRTEQQCNRRNNSLIEWNGERLPVAEWSRRTGIKAVTLYHRIARGWSAEATLTATPMARRKTSQPK